MSKKTIEITDTKAIRVEAVEINGQQYVSIRQLYKRKGDKEWSFAKQGINLPLEQAPQILKFATKYATSDDTTFTELQISRGRGDE